MPKPSSLTLTTPPLSLPCVGGGAIRRRLGQLPLWQALLPSGGTSRAVGAPAKASALAGGSPHPGAPPCVLTAGSHLLRPGHGRLPLAA
ncbi:hypothetical protein GW17_00061744 [Ensete ventricosum]|nr:hypothetical protein GW17_00061744 [Ensete ventricosum]RZR82789.1 hypothetical protein BHM03_00009274 [Ensete ventricosum]